LFLPFCPPFMTYDLRHEPWIPWRRRNGAIEWGPPTRLLDDLAGGRVFTGGQACDLGLIDKVGTLADAVKGVVACQRSARVVVGSAPTNHRTSPLGRVPTVDQTSQCSRSLEASGV
jgi:ClpP class serine protease